jgi:hypothetical protein
MVDNEGLRVDVISIRRPGTRSGRAGNGLTGGSGGCGGCGGGGWVVGGG